MAFVRYVFWSVAIVGNLLGVWLAWNGFSGLVDAATEGGASAAGAALGGGLILPYAFAVAIIPTCLAACVDRVTRP